MGPRMRISAAVLRSKVNPHCASHHLTLAEADLAMGLTGDHRILAALAGAHGYVLQRVEAGEGGSVLGAHLALSVAKGDLASVLADAVKDGRITANESTAIAGAGAQLQAAIVHLVSLAYSEARQVHLRAVAG